MTVAVSCNLSDGVILGVDSAVSVPVPFGIDKVYENAEKLFQLGDKPIGIAIFGLGAIGARTLGSYIREYELTDPDELLKNKEHKVSEIVESLRRYFLGLYDAQITPIVEEQSGMSITDIPVQHLPSFGLVVGGFSRPGFLSEVYGVSIPFHRDQPADLQRGPGDFGTNWFATFEPIRRYIKGFDPMLIDGLLQRIAMDKGITISEEEVNQWAADIFSPFEYQIPFAAMPMREGIAHTKFLVDLVINHYRFASGAPVVGGAARLGMVTYTEDRFEFIKDL